MSTPTTALLDLAGALRRALPLLRDDAELARQAQGVEAMIARRLGLPTTRPARAERRAMNGGHDAPHPDPAGRAAGRAVRPTEARDG